MRSSEDAFLEQLQPQWERLHAVAHRYARTSQDSQDLVQETLLRGWRNFSSSGGQPHQPAWLFVIMRNVAFEWNREAASKLRLKIVPNAELTELLAPDLGDPFESIPSMSEERFRESLDGNLAAAFDTLEDASREVLVLSVAGGLSYREIAEVLDCPIGTVMSRIARARRALRERLAQSVGSGRMLRGFRP